MHGSISFVNCKHKNARSFARMIVFIATENTYKRRQVLEGLRGRKTQHLLNYMLPPNRALSAKSKVTSVWRFSPSLKTTSKRRKTTLTRNDGKQRLIIYNYKQSQHEYKHLSITSISSGVVVFILGFGVGPVRWPTGKVVHSRVAGRADVRRPMGIAG